MTTTASLHLPFQVHTDLAGGHLVIRLQGELDLFSTDLLGAGVFADHAGIACVTVDMRDLDFIDTAGTRALLRLRAQHQRLGRGVRFVRARPIAARIFALLGSDLSQSLPPPRRT